MGRVGAGAGSAFDVSAQDGDFSGDAQEHILMDGSLPHVVALPVAMSLALAVTAMSLAAPSPAPSPRIRSASDARHLVCHLTKAHPVASGAPELITAIEEPDFSEPLGGPESHGDTLYVSGSEHGTCYFAAGSNRAKVRPVPRASQ